jgi:hypothetical protein
MKIRTRALTLPHCVAMSAVTGMKRLVRKYSDCGADAISFQDIQRQNHNSGQESNR